MRHFSTLFFALFLWSACNEAPNPHQAEIDKVDEMLFVTDSLIQEAAAIDSNRIKAEFALVDSAYKVLTGEGAPIDDKEYWTKTIGSLQYVHRPYLKYLRDVPKLNKDLNYSRNQLASLRNSLVDQKLDSNQIEEYLKLEEQALYNNFLLLTKRIGPTKEAMMVWDTAANRYLELLAKKDSLLN